MIARTHMAFGLLIGSIFSDSHLLMLGAIIGAILPDIDSAKSFLGKKAMPLSGFFERFLGHRGVLHSLLSCLALFFIAWLLSPGLGLGLGIGCVSHLLLDSFTVSGVQPFIPLKTRIRGSIRTGSFTDKLLFWLFLGLSLAFI